MHDHYPTILSTRDHDRVQAMMCTMIGARTPLASLVRHKLGSAVIMLPTDISPDVAAAGRRVRFIVDGCHSEERDLTWEPPACGDDPTLSLRLPRGLALLGLSVGEAISYETATRRLELIELDYVFPDDDDAVLEVAPLRESIFPAALPGGPAPMRDLNIA
jgi:hypothetical protein